MRFAAGLALGLVVGHFAWNAVAWGWDAYNARDKCPQGYVCARAPQP